MHRYDMIANQAFEKGSHKDVPVANSFLFAYFFFFANKSRLLRRCLVHGSINREPIIVF